MSRSVLWLRLGALFLVTGAAGWVHAQNRVRFPSVAQTPSGTYPPPPGPTPWTTPGATPFNAVAPGATLGQQIEPFDPYALGQPTPQAPPLTYPQPGTGFPGSQPILPNVSPAVPGTPGLAPPPPLLGVPGAPPPASLPPTLSGSPLNAVPPPPLMGAPPTPAPAFPNGLPWTDGGPYQRLIQDTGFVDTWLAGDGQEPDELGINEVDISTSVVFHNFAHSPNGLRVSPGFTFDFLAGPQGVISPDADAVVSLPPRLYAAYLDSLWHPQLTPQFSADLNFRVGVYSDLDKVTSNSIRFIGRGLGVLQLTPTLAFLAGIEYLDRNDIKLLPAGGVLWTPNPQTNFDIYFPRPKLAQYLTSIGNTEFWWYIGGEYGGGAWTFERQTDPWIGMEERIDINDIRVFIGVDWNRLERIRGLFEVGYVFDRQIVVVNHPNESVDLEDTVMVRGGITF